VERLAKAAEILPDAGAFGAPEALGAPDVSLALKINNLTWR
jgi:hypothetical protein